jgi:dihydropteroate synthase
MTTQIDLVLLPIFNFKNNEQRLMFTLNCKGRLLVVDKPIVMGIINATPDSFYKGSRFSDEEAILRQSEQMLKEGAVIIDVGGQSTRPGSSIVSIDEELKRVTGPIKAIQRHFPNAIISIDTFHSKVAKEAVDAGASIVNDISAGSIDPLMTKTVADLKVPYVLMHMQGNPQTMHNDPQYKDIAKEVLDFFIARLEELKKAGIVDIIIDPGFGFGKTAAHNFELLRKLSVLKIPGRLILIGISRKSTIYNTLGITPEEAINGTTVLHTIGLMNGANILRAHDVKEAVEAIQLFTAYMQ